ncbi:hypothetical protein D3C81_2325500 [compost metagenome]
MAYVGFSLPVIVTGLIGDWLGMRMALVLFGMALLAGSVAIAVALARQHSQRLGSKKEHSAYRTNLKEM